MDVSVVQTISQIVIFIGAIAIALCNHYKDEQPAARTARHGFGSWRAWIARNARQIILCSAIAIAVGILCDWKTGEMVSRLSLERSNEQIRNIQRHYDSILEPINKFSETSGLSIQQAIVELLDYKAAEITQERKRQAVVAVSDLYRMLKNYDTHFKERSCDSASFSIRKRVGMESGVYITGMIKFAEDARRERDNLLDSALVRLTQLDVDTDTLRFQRRLPIRMGQVLKGRAKALDVRGDIMTLIHQCDTL